jgi:hypothetical protein
MTTSLPAPVPLPLIFFKVMATEQNLFRQSRDTTLKAIPEKLLVVQTMSQRSTGPNLPEIKFRKISKATDSPYSTSHVFQKAKVMNTGDKSIST